MAECVIINHFFLQSLLMFEWMQSCGLCPFKNGKYSYNQVRKFLEKLVEFFFLQSALGICGLGSLQACVFWI